MSPSKSCSINVVANKPDFSPKLIDEYLPIIWNFVSSLKSVSI